MLKRQTLLLALVACFGLAQVANAAVIDIQFRDQGDGEWAVEMIGDVEVFSLGLYIPGATGFQSQLTLTPGTIIGMPGVQAGVNAAEDPLLPWTVLDATMLGLAPGVSINPNPGMLPVPSLGPAGTYLALGMLYGVSQSQIMSGDGWDPTPYWGPNVDQYGTVITASEVHFTFAPEPGALMLLGLGLAGLAFIRRR